jgi:acyl dehydratase
MSGDKDVEVELPKGLITDQALRELAKQIGLKISAEEMGNWFNSEVTIDSIKHFADGIGDTNPLWCDEEYVKTKTRYKTVIAPPNWLYSVCPTTFLFSPYGDPLRGVHGFHSGNDWLFYKPARLYDKIKPEIINVGFTMRRSQFAGKICIQYTLANYHNQNEEVIARAYAWIIRAERREAKERGKYSRYILPHPWSEEELKHIEEDILSEENEIRGSKPRFWEDTQIGEEMKLTKGPLGLTDMIAYSVGANPMGLKAFRAALKVYRRHPRWSIRDSTTFAREPIFAVHYNKAIANAAGLPYPYDVGAQRNIFLIQMLTDWMGDDGWLKRCYAEYRRFFYFSDTIWFRGKVVDKFIDEDNEPCVGIEIHAVNQRGEDTTPGYAVVVLPSREYDYWPIEVRLKGKKLGIK